MAIDPTYPLYPIACFISMILVLIPLPWHMQAWNTGTVMYMLWTAVGLLNQFVNSIVWKDNAINWAPVWCDISARIIIGTSVAIPAASLVISIRLWKIARVQTVTETRRQKRNGFILDFGLTLGLPVLVMILQYIVQGHRFNIYEQVGCFPATFNTAPAYPLVFMWPVVLGLVSLVFCVMTVHAFLKRRREMSQFLSSNAQVTFSRYFRLMALACMDTLLTIPLGAFNIWVNVNSGPDPWRGWADAHWGFARVGTFPAILWRNDPTGRLSFNLTRAFIIVCAVVFFAFFGFADEARKNYRKVFWGVARRFGYTMPTGTTRGLGTSAVRTPNLAGLNSSMGATRGGLGAPRVYITTETKSEKRDSFLSSVGDLSSSFSISSRKSLDEKYEHEKDSKQQQLSPASTTSSSSSSSSASGSFIDMTATVASRRSFDSMRDRDVESAPVTPAEEVELRGLPRLTVDAPSHTAATRGPNMV